MAADTFSFYLATRIMPLADVMTFYMAAPLIIIALSAPLLGEKVERFRWIAVAVGFVGVLIALRPTPQMFSWVSLLALFGATMFALGQVVTRKLRRTHWLQLIVWQFVGAGLIGAATTPFAWATPSRLRPCADVPAGVVSMVCFIFHHPRAGDVRAAALAPLQYISIVWARRHRLAGVARRADLADRGGQRDHHRQRAVPRRARRAVARRRRRRSGRPDATGMKEQR